MTPSRWWQGRAGGPKQASIRGPLAILVLLLAGATGNGLPAAEVPRPGPDAVCPVCGMFVTKYPEWVATVLFTDGTVHHFDGAKDLFKYVLDLARYAPGTHVEAIETAAVTEYYELRPIDARTAWYVAGSDVLGPMGHELVPLATEADAQAFLADHGGTRILRFDEVDVELLRDLDAGRLGRYSRSTR
jgi:nitrous oxide reductase accessory protein NosL